MNLDLHNMIDKLDCIKVITEEIYLTYQNDSKAKKIMSSDLEEKLNHFYDTKIKNLKEKEAEAIGIFNQMNNQLMMILGGECKDVFNNEKSNRNQQTMPSPKQFSLISKYQHLEKLFIEFKALYKEYEKNKNPIIELCELALGMKKKTHHDLISKVVIAKDTVHQIKAEVAREVAILSEQLGVEKIGRAQTIEDLFHQDIQDKMLIALSKIDKTMPFELPHVMMETAVKINNIENPKRMLEYLPIANLSLVDHWSQHNHMSSILRIYNGQYHQHRLTVPAFWSRKDKNHLWIEGENNHTLAKESVLGIMDFLIKHSPILSQKFVLFDSVHRGAQFRKFSQLFNRIPEMIDGRILTETEDLEKVLGSICREMDTTIQKQLSDYSNYYEYHKDVIGAEAYKMIVIFDYPHGMSNRALDRLRHIVINGHKCGIDVVIVNTGKDPNEKGTSQRCFIDEVKGAMKCLSIENGQLISDEKIIFDGYRWTEWKAGQLEKYIDNYLSEKSKSFNYLDLLLKYDYQKSNTLHGIKIPIGINEAGESQYLEFGTNTSHSGIITGGTGSGKSTSLHNIIQGALWLYPPEELNLYLLDFKGTEFNLYRDKKLPQIKFLASESSQVFGESLLENLHLEYEARIKLCKEAGDMRSITEYRQNTGRKMSRILLIIDEYEGLYALSGNKIKARNAAAITHRLVTKGRAFGIHLLFASQTVNNHDTGISLSPLTLEQMNVRIGLRQARKSMVALLGDNGNSAYELLTHNKGVAIYNEDYSLLGGNQRFISAFISHANSELLLSTIEECSSSYPDQTRVFDGGQQLTIRLEEYHKRAKALYQTARFHFEIGQDIQSDSIVTVVFNNQQRNHLIVIGEEGKMFKLQQHLLSSIAKCSPEEEHHNKNPYQWIYIDGDLLGSSSELVNRANELPEVIETLYNEMNLRKQLPLENHQIKMVWINNMQWFDQILDTISDFNINQVHDDIQVPSFKFLAQEFTNNYPKKSHQTMLKALFKEGYRYQIHFIITCNDPQYVKDEMLDSLKYFPNRILFDMSQNDYDRFGQSIDGMSINDSIVVLRDGRNRSTYYKPYQIQ